MLAKTRKGLTGSQELSQPGDQDSWSVERRRLGRRIENIEVKIYRRSLLNRAFFTIYREEVIQFTSAFAPDS